MDTPINTIEQKKKWVDGKKPISDTIMIAVLTGASYLAAFAYQYTYLGYFGVPQYYVEINLGMVLFVALIMLLWFISLGFPFIYLIEWEPKSKISDIFREILVVLFVGWSVFLPAIAYSYDPLSFWKSLIYFFIIFAFFVYFVVMFFRSETPKSVYDKFLDKLELNHGTSFILVLGSIFFFVVGAHASGLIFAKFNNEFLVPNSNQNLAVISSYSDGFIALPFDGRLKKFTKEIIFISKEEIIRDNVIFSIKELGVLTPQR